MSPFSLINCISYRNVVLFNTLSRNRNEPICIQVDSLDAGVEADPPIKKQQVSPVIAYDEEKKTLVVKNGIFEVIYKGLS